MLSEIVRHAANDALTDGSGGRLWNEVSELMVAQMTVAVAAVPIAGVYSAVVDANDDALPLSVGDVAVAGHLDETLEAAVDALARRHGLVGFRFTRESWWTEDLMTAKGDPQIGQEIMAEYADRDDWPWFVIASRVSSSGVAAEAEGVLNAEAFIGALALLDHPPGRYWREGLPWIPGQQSRMADPFAPVAPDSPPDTQPQVVDVRARRLQMADSESLMAVGPPAIDAGAHLTGPALPVLAQLLGSEGGLAGACRLAFHAGWTWSPEAQHSLAAGAVKEMLEAIEIRDTSAYDAAIAVGVRWRTAYEPGWPRQRWEREHELDAHGA